MKEEKEKKDSLKEAIKEVQEKQVAPGEHHAHSSRRRSRTYHAVPEAPMAKKKRSMPRRRFAPTRPTLEMERRKETGKIPPVGENIRIIPLGGVEEIGKNMTVIEINGDIIVIDIGFKFKEEDTPGIDYILPNTKYLEERKEKVRAVIITHGHLDHIGGIPYIMDKIGNPPLYTRNLTAFMIKKRQAEFPHLAPIDYKIVEKNDRIKIGNMSVRFFGVTHSIPDSMGVVVETPYGLIVNPGDFKLTHKDGEPVEEEDREYSELAKEKVLLFLGESTNIENPGFSTPEEEVHKNLDEIIRTIKGRLIIGMFASHILRMMKVIEACEKYGKKLVIEGRSMKNNIDILEQAKMLEIKKGTVISSQNMGDYPPDKIVVLATGAQGDEFAALMRMGTKTHKHFHINERDTVLLSSSIVPGNERSVEKLKDNLARLGAKIISIQTSDVYIHSTGHGNRGEIEWLHRKLRPKFFIPIHGNHYRLKLHAEVAENLGIPKNNIIVPDDGTVVEIQDKGQKIVALKEKAPSGTVMVDGFAIGDMQDVVIRDRQMLAQDGMFIVFAIVNSQTGKLKKSPDIISRGFVYLRESQDLLRQARFVIKKTIEENTAGMHPINFEYVKNNVADAVGKFLFQKTAKRPIVIPVLLGV
ncbi:MAG TPA: ribonuclease J [Candidatus Paceibacterota bacterium]|nr:ribonuclease J [Candidatus Paceibacterota bacterium]